MAKSIHRDFEIGDQLPQEMQPNVNSYLNVSPDQQLPHKGYSIDWMFS